MAGTAIAEIEDVRAGRSARRPERPTARRLEADTPLAASPSTPALLTMAGYGGSLAAVRCLGRAGIPVTVAFNSPAQPAAWSRWTTHRVRSPTPADPQRFMDWLLRFGRREPAHVLYPTCDDLAYLFARHEAEVRRSFLVYQPPLESVLAMLDKKALLAAATRAGIDSAVTWVPEDESEVERIARQARFPLLIKPRTQLLWPTLDKGTRVDRREDLLPTYVAYLRTKQHLPMLLAERPDLARPLVQEYHSEAEEQIESVAGFIDQSGAVLVARAAVKVLQRPRRIGIGVCFEHAPLEAATAAALATLCRHTGYYGVFEAEFIRTADRRLLIDFNPRYYNQMGFEIARGLPLPLLTHAAACGDLPRLRAIALGAHAPREDEAAVYCDWPAMAMMLGAQRLSGRMDAREMRRWRDWYARHRHHAVDPAFDREDIVPGVLAAAGQLWRVMRHPRAFFRSTVLNQ
jgi:D-aspartate ligase